MFGRSGMSCSPPRIYRSQQGGDVRYRAVCMILFYITGHRKLSALHPEPPHTLLRLQMKLGRLIYDLPHPLHLQPPKGEYPHLLTIPKGDFPTSAHLPISRVGMTHHTFPPLARRAALMCSRDPPSKTNPYRICHPLVTLPPMIRLCSHRWPNLRALPQLPT